VKDNALSYVTMNIQPVCEFERLHKKIAWVGYRKPTLVAFYTPALDALRPSGTYMSVIHVSA